MVLKMQVMLIISQEITNITNKMGKRNEKNY